MYKIIILIVVWLISISFNSFSQTNKNLVSNQIELENAIKSAEPGDNIVLANGVWQNLEIYFYAQGKKDNPITLSAETPGKVTLEGQSCLKIGGEYLVVDGLYFTNGYTPNNTVIDFRISKNKIANNCRVINTVIEDFNQPNRYDQDHWVELWGRHNKLDQCYIAGKSNQGPTIRVYLSGNEHIRNYHQITNNYFGPRPRKGGPKAETMQIGDSYTSMTPSYVQVANNYFEKCNGEVEIISSKSNFNEFRNNIFFECEGSLVMRHGNYCIIDGNFFIGNKANEFVGGIRVINTGHWITNNYFYNLKADEFRSPLAIMNGIPKSPLNRYNQVTDVVIAYNSWINCISPWQFSVGANMNKKDFLPKSEIRSARPERIVIANNVIYNQLADSLPIKAYDKVDGVLFKNNLIDNPEFESEYEGLETTKLKMEKKTDWLYLPSKEGNDKLEKTYYGFGFEDIKTDIFGNARSKNNIAGAIVNEKSISSFKFDKNKYGAQWYSPDKLVMKNSIVQVSASHNNISQHLNEASSGDILELANGEYKIDESIIINKTIIIRAKDQNGKVKLIYSGENDTPLFQMHPKGNLKLENISLSGNKEVLAFSTLKNNMSNSYVLNLEACQINNFSKVLKAYRGSFADSVSIYKTKFIDCLSGIELAAETEDKGDYNAEFVSVIDCEFENINKDVINFYRGGYDESTIGGNLIIKKSTFKNCGQDEESKILIKTRGIINVNISNNTFLSNPVKLVALLWGEKNNKYSENEIKDSGEIRVDKYLKQKLVY